MLHSKMHGYYPLGLNISGKECLVIGGGKVAERKIGRLLEYGARVTVISLSLTQALQKLFAEGDIRYCHGKFSSGLIKRQALIFAATDDPKLNQRIVHAAERKGIPANCVNPGRSSIFIVPSLLRRPSFTLAVSTDGRSPSFAKKIKGRLERVL